MTGALYRSSEEHWECRRHIWVMRACRLNMPNLVGILISFTNIIIIDDHEFQNKPNRNEKQQIIALFLIQSTNIHKHYIIMRWINPPFLCICMRVHLFEMATHCQRVWGKKENQKFRLWLSNCRDSRNLVVKRTNNYLQMILENANGSAHRMQL